jgi:hypothetical protein
MRNVNIDNSTVGCSKLTWNVKGGESDLCVLILLNESLGVRQGEGFREDDFVPRVHESELRNRKSLTFWGLSRLRDWFTFFVFLCRCP